MNGTWMEAARFLAAPFVLCLLLTGIHCYLGLHVLARGVIFVDLSLAQVAAFGMTLALFLGSEPGSAISYAASFGATLLAAGVFAFARSREKVFPQEALIGITYALAGAATVLAADRLPHGAEHLREILLGQVLWATWGDVGKTTAVYGAVGFLHFIFRKPLVRASFDSEAPHSPAWDFMFYALFGVVITCSVRLAGVLQVFAFLISPSLISSFFFRSLGKRLAFGWGLGFVLCFLSLAASVKWDLPSGALLVTAFTILPILCLPFLGRVRSV